MARRAGKIKEIREMHRNVLVLDCGDAFRVKGKFPELWTEAVLAGLDLIGYDAVNVGEVELALGTRFFNEMTMKMTVPFVSANLSDSNGRLSRVKTYVIKEFDSIRVGVTGVTPTVFFKDEILKEDGIVVNSPLKALRQVLKELREKTDIIILLSHLGYKGTKDFLEYNDFSGIDVVVAGHGRKLLNKPEKVNGTLVVQNSMGGEYLGRLMLTLGPDGSIRRFEGEVVALTNEMPVDNEALRIVEELRRKEGKEEQRLKKEKEEKEMRELQTKYLKMTPQEFLEMMKRENAAKMPLDGPAEVPVQ